MATVTNWIDHLSAAEVQGAIYPYVGSEGILVIVALVIVIVRMNERDTCYGAT